MKALLFCGYCLKTVLIRDGKCLDGNWGCCGVQMVIIWSGKQKDKLWAEKLKEQGPQGG
jgi:hypothetical protein